MTLTLRKLAAPWLLLAGLLGLIVLAAGERYALRTVIAITDARKATRDLVILARQLDAHLQMLDRAHTRLLLGGGVVARQLFETTDARLQTDLAQLTAGAAAMPEFSRPAMAVADAVTDARRLLAGHLRPPPPSDVAAILARVEAGDAAVTAAQVLIERLNDAMYQRIGGYDQAVRAWQRRAGLVRAGLLALVLVLLGGAYGLLWAQGRRLRRAEVTVRRGHEQLEAIVKERTAQLETSQQNLRALAASLDESVETERRRLARDVHDQLGQTLAVLKLHVQHRLPQDPGLRECDRLLDEAIATARRIAADLRPPLLDDLGLAAALQQLSQRLGLNVTVRVQDDHLLTARQSEQLFRIVQEALTNVSRHAQAEHVYIEGGAAGTHYLLAVEDDGVGVDAAPPRPGALGMLGMRERAQLAGGECRWVRPRHGGTRVEIRLPLALGEAGTCASC